jgi:HNH endonuclease
MANRANTRDNFEALVERGPGCWEWQGTVWGTGYGRFQFEGRSQKTHRLAWLFENGALSEEECVLHTCDNRRCVRPSHLFIGDRRVNNLDKTAKGRQTKGCDVNTAKLTADKVRAIRASSDTSDALAALFGVSRDHINKVKRREVWSHV